jgi:UDP-N-acetylglucosamine--N-acetylmuramyl-(pentapeptide) pyrophosphoryl-undecaprenol N-acetylglucosamine transferase
MSRVLFAGGGTGGHLYPALALADALRSERSDIAVHFAGAERGVEARVLPRRGEPHTLLPFQPLVRARPWQNWRLVPSLARSFAGLSRLFRVFRPRLVVGTGGYASGPACFWAVTRGVPVAVQEQNSWPGLTTRLVSRWARQVHLGFPEAERHLRPGRRTRVLSLGNPIRPPDFTLDRNAARRAFGLQPESTVVLVVGGSQGARAVNERLIDALRLVKEGRLAERPAGVEILWATGPSHIESIAGRIGTLDAGSWVHALGYIEDMPRALRAADLAISRAGAMATAELLAWGIPMLLVPLPTAAANHQLHNARALEAAGAAVCLEEAQLSPERLWQEVVSLAGDTQRRAQMAELGRSRAQPDAARAIARELLTLLTPD